MLKIRIVTPIPISGNKGDKVIITKGEDGLYYASLENLTIGLAKRVISDTEINLPDQITAEVCHTFKGRKTFTVICKETV